MNSKLNSYLKAREMAMLRTIETLQKKLFITVILWMIIIAPIAASEYTVPPEMQDEWDKFTEKYGTNWQITHWNNYSNSPSILYGSYSIGRNITSKTDAEQIANEFIDDTQDLFKLKPQDLKLNRIREDYKFYKANYDQYYNDTFIENSGFRLVMVKSGRIIKIGNKFHPNISISTVPTITEEEVEQIVNETYPPPKYAPLPSFLGGGTSLLIHPVEENTSLKYYLAWKVQLEGFVVYVDAHTGEIISGAETEISDDIEAVPIKNESDASETNLSTEEFESNNTAPPQSQNNVSEVQETNETTVEEIDSTTTTTPTPTYENVTELIEPKETTQETEKMQATIIQPTGKTSFLENKFLPVLAVAIALVFFIILFTTVRNREKNGK